MPRDEKFLTHEQKFQRFYRGFTNCPPSAAALKLNQLSTKDPVRYLQASKLLPASASTFSKAADVKSARLPTKLEKMVDLQSADGHWEASKEFINAMGGTLPAAPPGISPWRWATALATAIIRQQPEFYNELEKIHERAMMHVDEDLLAYAREHLASMRLNMESNMGMAEETIVPVQVTKSNPTNNKALTQEYRFLSKTEKAVLKAGLKVELSMVVNPLEEVFQKGDLVESCWRKEDRWGSPYAQGKWYTAKVVRIHQHDGSLDLLYQDLFREQESFVARKYVRNLQSMKSMTLSDRLDTLSETWNRPIPLKQEMRRVKQITKDYEGSRKNIREWEEKNKKIEKAKPVHQKHHVDMVDAITSLQCYTEPVPGIDQTQTSAINSLLQRDKLMQQVPKLARECQVIFSTTKLYRVKLKAFNPLTSLLKSIVEKTVEIIEEIVRWRTILSTTSGIQMTYGDSPPFIWNGTNVLLQLPRSMDFLDTFHELKGWYGPDFSFVRNPFLRAVPLDERASTPRSATRKIGTKTGGIVEDISPMLLTKREEEMKALAAAEEKIAQGAIWWPEQLYSGKLKERIRAAEKVLIQEEENQRLVAKKTMTPS